MRTSAVAIEAIIEVDSGVDLTPFITVANALVTEVCAVVSTYDADRLELIERWLSAHFYTVLNPRYTAEKIASIAVNYQSAIDLGFNSSHYGQVAMRLDTNGGLAKLDAKAKQGGGVSSFNWLGKNKADDLAEGN